MAQHRIVVGFDGSEGAQQALNWALREARLREAVLEVVHAYEVPAEQDLGVMSASMLGGVTSGYIHTLEISNAEHAERRDRARRYAVDLIEKALEQASVAGVKVMPNAVLDRRPAKALLAAAAGADLLVVGSRGLGGFRGLLLGSVSLQVAHHAPCPVVVIPGNRRTAPAKDEQPAQVVESA